MGAGEIVTAQVMLDAAYDALAQHFYTSLDGYARGINNHLKDLSLNGFKLPEIKDATEELEALTSIDTSSKPAIDAALFGTINAINFKLRALLAEIARQVFRKVSDTVAVLRVKDITLPDPAAVTIVTNQSNQIVHKINEAGARPDLLLAEITTRLAALETAMEAAINNQVNGIEEKEEKEEKEKQKEQEDANKILVTGIATDLDAGHYRDAARKVVLLVKANPPEKTRGAGVKAKFVSDIIPPAMTAPLSNNNYSMAGFNQTNSPAPDNNNTVAGKYKAATVLIARAKKTQNILSGVVITVIGYALHAEGFLGTPLETAGVFFWAFLMDVSVGTLTSGLVAKIGK
jgi:hypothetical protein